MLDRSLELITINLVDIINFLQLLRTRLQRLLVANDVAVVRRCIGHIHIEVDCILS